MQKPIIIVALLILFLSACSRPGQDKTVIDVQGFQQIKQNEFEQHLNKYKEAYRRTYLEAPPKDSLRKWYKYYLGGLLYAAEAKNNELDTISNYSILLENRVKQAMTRSYGYYWSILDSTTNSIDPAAVKAFYDKLDKILYADILRFPNERELNKYVQSESIADYDEFRQTAENAQRNGLQGCNFQLSFQWPMKEPFIEINEDIYQLKEHEISEPLKTLNGYYIFYIDRTEKVKIRSMDILQKQIEEIIPYVQTTKTRLEQLNKIKEEMHLTINQEAFDPVSNKISERIIRPGIKNEFSNLNDTLFHFLVSGQHRYITINQFLDFLFSKANEIPVSNVYELENHLYSLAFREIIHTKASDLGLYEHNEFQIIENHIRNDILAHFYREKFVKTRVNIAETELMEYYNHHKNNYVEGGKCQTYLLTFDDKNTAQYHAPKIAGELRKKNTTTSNLTEIFGDIRFIEEKELSMSDTLSFPPYIIELVFSIPEQKLAGPIELNDQVILIWKEKEVGTRIKGFEEVKGEIHDILFRKELQELTDTEVRELREKYEITSKAKL